MHRFWPACLTVAAALASAPAAHPQSASPDQAPPTAPPLVVDDVTVIDVEQGRLRPAQRVVIVGNRIRAVGNTGAVAAPRGARVVNAKGKYLIPGLWDLHVHPGRQTNLYYPLFVANGITGIRDGGSEVPIDTLRLWRREILAGTRAGPPRQLLSGQSIAGPIPDCQRNAVRLESPLAGPLVSQMCIVDSADAVRVVDSLVAAGADMIKPRAVSQQLYFAIAAQARRRGIPFGGHATVFAVDAADSGTMIVDHSVYSSTAGTAPTVYTCWRWDSGPVAVETAIASCRPVADRFRLRGTWYAPTQTGAGDPVGSATAEVVIDRLTRRAREFWAGASLRGNWLHDSTGLTSAAGSGIPIDSLGSMYVMQHVGLPIVASTDVGGSPYRVPPGFALHAELAMYVAEGMTPLGALQTATLNPAKMLRATDSLGTVAPGKLADLVLLDANPLADITNTTTIRAVVANGRYLDRATLDRLVAAARTDAAAIPLASLKAPIVVLPTSKVTVTADLQADPRYAALRTHSDSALRAWADSILEAVLATRVSRDAWVSPSMLGALAKAGKVKDPGEYRTMWQNTIGAAGYDQNRFREVRTLATATGGRSVLVPVAAMLRVGTGPGAAGICADVLLRTVDASGWNLPWANYDFVAYEDDGRVPFASTCGPTPAAALAAAVAAALPPARRAP